MEAAGAVIKISTTITITTIGTTTNIIIMITTLTKISDDTEVAAAPKFVPVVIMVEATATLVEADIATMVDDATVIGTLATTVAEEVIATISTATKITTHAARIGGFIVGHTEISPIHP